MVRNLLFCFFCVGFFSILSAQTITNVAANQIGNQVQISYQMIGFTAPQQIEIICSTDGGNSFTVPVRSATGDIGSNVMPGGTKNVTWNVLNDVQSLHCNNAIFKVTAKAVGGAASNGFELDFDGVKMQVYEMKRSGNTVRLNYKLVSPNKDQRAYMHVGNMRMIDNEGNVFDKEIRVTLGTVENRSNVEGDLVQGIPMKGNIAFKNIPSNVRNIALFEMKLNDAVRQHRNINLP